ncbi:hypothetical protein [Idiomarina xiamenensis]|uniref:Uncharacterized protein n=1 Tax=Idiomarina xiamenensis 10-D-4 TaxID=740709 RepID=K2JTY9_9GAMM|nr:hypothetical protein [Idiomarina xiamenensis]EKE86911.1 hypothetical protein A10D4_01677 [Idiomarina xiamenensis 10-D-4]
MSKLDKDKVLAAYKDAYQKAHGKAPSIDSNNGWYSVDGGKNVRLADLAEETKQLAKGGSSDKAGTEKSAAAKKDSKAAANKNSGDKKAASSKSSSAKSSSKSSSTKSSSTKSSSKKSSSNSGGMTAKELWKQKLESDARQNRLPRGKF